jgi:hypothetical protein
MAILVSLAIIISPATIQTTDFAYGSDFPKGFALFGYFAIYYMALGLFITSANV